jgi:quinol monooxygenase YgiN
MIPIIEWKGWRMITMTVVVKVRTEKQEEFLQAMRSLNNGPEKQQGLRKSTLYQEIEDKTGFSLIYQWETQEDLDRYLGAEKFRVLLGALKVLCEKSEIRYRHISEEWGSLEHGSYDSRSALRTGSE